MWLGPRLVRRSGYGAMPSRPCRVNAPPDQRIGHRRAPGRGRRRNRSHRHGPVLRPGRGQRPDPQTLSTPIRVASLLRSSAYKVRILPPTTAPYSARLRRAGAPGPRPRPARAGSSGCWDPRPATIHGQHGPVLGIGVAEALLPPSPRRASIGSARSWGFPAPRPRVLHVQHAQYSASASPQALPGQDSGQPDPGGQGAGIRGTGVRLPSPVPCSASRRRAVAAGP